MTEQARTLGHVVSLWRYPVKSMIGEELNASEVTERGLLGDRAYALLDPTTGKIVSAKNPGKWARMFDFRARFVEAPKPEGQMPQVIVTCPDGTMVESGSPVRDSPFPPERGCARGRTSLGLCGGHLDREKRADRRSYSRHLHGSLQTVCDDDATSGGFAAGWEHPPHGRQAPRRECRCVCQHRSRRSRSAWGCGLGLRHVA